MQPPQHDVDAMTFRLLMERADNAPQNRSMIVPRRGAAMADWRRFSIGLGERFFEATKAALVTETLINKPPRTNDLTSTVRHNGATRLRLLPV